MKFAVTNDHISFFRENQSILLDELLTESQQQTLREGINAALTLRLGPAWKEEDPDEIFVGGHDLHCDNERIRSVISQRRLASVISEFLDCSPLRLGYDQYLPVNRRRSNSEEDPYGEFLNSGGTLKEVSCIQGLKGGLILCLEEPEHEDPESFFPSQPGQGVLFRPYRPFPLSFLDGQTKGAYLLATYTDEIAIYLHNERDPHLYAFKRWGYSYGDKLREPHHPIIFR